MSIYYALANNGKLYDLCDCGDFDAAEESAEDLGLDEVVWIADQETADQWKDILTRRDVHPEPYPASELAAIEKLLCDITLPEEMEEECENLTKAITLLKEI